MESSFLELARGIDDERPFSMTYEVEGFAHISTVLISLSSDSLGLLLRFDTKGKRMNEIESRNDGRIVLFRDIYKMECVYSQTRKGGRTLNSMKIILNTPEDDLILESLLPLQEIETWATIARECIMFCIIPLPKANPDSTVIRSGGAVPVGRDGFRATSGAVFGANVDVTFLINSVLEDPVIRTSETFPSIAKLCQYMGDIFGLIQEVKCNRIAFGVFSGRLAEMMRLLLDPQSVAGGLLLGTDSGSTGLITFQLGGMCLKGLTNALDFIQDMCNPEWLQKSMKYGSVGFREKFEQLEQDILIKCANRIIKGLRGNGLLSFKKHNYDMVVEINQSLDAIGSIDQIYNNPAKIQTFAKVLQGDPKDIFSELELVLEKENKLDRGTDGADGEFTPSYDTISLSSTNDTSGSVATVEKPHQRGSLLASLCCCCRSSGKKNRQSTTVRRKSYKFSNGSSGNGLDQRLINNRTSGESTL